MKSSSWRRYELWFLVLYAVVFYAIIIRRSLQLAHDHGAKLYGLRPGWLAGQFNDVSDAQWRNFRGNLPILSVVFGIFTLIASMFRTIFSLKANGMSVVWLLISLAYLSYLHGAWYLYQQAAIVVIWGGFIHSSDVFLFFPCSILFIIAIASANFLLVKIFARTKYFSFVLWIVNLSFLICNRIYEGYKFSSFGDRWAHLDNFRGTFRWHICFNFVVLRMISFGYDYHWVDQHKHFDQKKHIQRCDYCSSGKTCFHLLQEKRATDDKFSFPIYLCYLVYAPLYIAGPILSFNAFVSQLDSHQKIYSSGQVAWYGCRWIFSLLLMELMSHMLYYNAFASSGLWKHLSPMDIFIIGYGVLNFMWLKFFLIWRYFRLWSMVNGIVAPENMPRCINNCHNLESFWKNWHASFNRWLVRYVYIPLGGSQKKLLNVWVIFTFVAVWHDLEWKLLSWAWLTCIFFIPEMLVKSMSSAVKVEGPLREFVFRELSAVAGAVTIACLMVANLVGFVIGPSGINWLVSGFLQEEGWPTLGWLLFTFYVGTKLMFHIADAKQRKERTQ